MSDLGPSGHARAACEHIHGLNRAAMRVEHQLPAESAEQLAELAAVAAALPQACSQLSAMLEQAADRQTLRMDTASAETDPTMAVDLARLHLDEARLLAVDLHKRLDAAHQATAHIFSQGDDDVQETTSGDEP